MLFLCSFIVKFSRWVNLAALTGAVITSTYNWGLAWWNSVVPSVSPALNTVMPQCAPDCTLWKSACELWFRKLSASSKPLVAAREVGSANSRSRAGQLPSRIGGDSGARVRRSILGARNAGVPQSDALLISLAGTDCRTAAYDWPHTRSWRDREIARSDAAAIRAAPRSPAKRIVGPPPATSDAHGRARFALAGCQKWSLRPPRAATSSLCHDLPSQISSATSHITSRNVSLKRNPGGSTV